MSYPTKYARQYDFLTFQNANPTRPLPGDKVNIDFNYVVTSIDEIVEFLKLFVSSEGVVTASTATVATLSAVEDVTLTSIASGEILKWDGSGWVNNTLAEAGIAAASHVHAASDVTTGTLAHERGGLEADVSAYSGLVKISGGSTSAVTDNSANWNTAYGWGDHGVVGYLTSSDIGSAVQAYDADLDTWAGITPSANVQSIVSAANYAAVRALLDLEAGTDFYSISAADAAFQPLDADLTAIAALTTTAAGLTALEIADPGADRVLAWDDTAGVVVPIALADITAEASPATGDYVLIYGAEGDLRKVDWSDLPAGGGGGGDLVDDTSPQLGGALDGQGYDLNNLGVVFLTEQAAAESDAAGKGQLWVLTATPNVLKFTDDAGSDWTPAMAENLASTSNALGASLIGIEDSGTLITATTVEGALAENRAAIDAIEADYLTSSAIGVSVQAYDADLTTWAGLTPSSNAQSLVTAADYAAMRALLDLEAGTDFYSVSAADAAFAALTDLASTSNGEGAALIGVEDSGGLITATTVEGALAENRAAIDAIEADYLTSSAVGVSVQAYDADLDTWAGLTPSSNAQSLVTAANYAAMRALLDLEAGTDFYSISAADAAFATAAQGALADSALQDVVDDATPQLGGALDGQGYDLNNLGVVFLTEQAAAEADVTGKGQLWVLTATPNVLKFTDDAGSDWTPAMAENLASTSNALGASLIGIEDSGTLITATTVEGALAENRAAIDAIEADYLTSSDIGSAVQAYDADLDTWAGLTPSANAQSLVTAADYAAMRGLLDLEAGTDFYSISAADAAFQPIDADLTAVAELSSAGIIARTGAGTAAARTVAGTSDQISVANGDGVSGNPTLSLANNVRDVPVTVVLNGGGLELETGVAGDIEVPFSGTIVAVRMFADQAGDAVVDIWKDTYANYPPTDADSIVAAAPPTLSSANKSEDTTLSGWTTAVSAGDVLRFNIDSCSTITRCTVALTIRRT